MNPLLEGAEHHFLHFVKFFFLVFLLASGLPLFGDCSGVLIKSYRSQEEKY